MSFHDDARDLFGLSRDEADYMRHEMGEAYDWDDVTDWGEDASIELETLFDDIEVPDWVDHPEDYFFPDEDYEISFEYEEAK